MAQIYVGFHDQRSSSRILKPPGGGTSDIFGTDSPKKVSQPNTPTKDDNSVVKNEDTPEEKHEINSSEDSKQEQSNTEEPKIENLNINEENGEKTEDSPNEKVEIKPDTISDIIKQENKVQSPVTEEKKTPQRVPPGGYSSGLW